MQRLEVIKKRMSERRREERGGGREEGREGREEGREREKREPSRRRTQSQTKAAALRERGINGKNFGEREREKSEMKVCEKRESDANRSAKGLSFQIGDYTFLKKHGAAAAGMK